MSAMYDERRDMFFLATAEAEGRPNCPRYIHTLRTAWRSAFVPRPGHAPPVPEWKTKEWARDVLPADDPARGQ